RMMRLVCPNCGAQYEVDRGLIPEAGRDVQCSNCGNTWFQAPPEEDLELAEELGQPEPEVTQAAAEPEQVPEPQEPDQPEQEPAEDPEPVAEHHDDEGGSFADVSEPEPEPEPDFPSVAAATSPTALDILREEAAREMAARRAAQHPLESQPELGVEEAAPAAPVEKRARMARLRGEPEPRIDASGTELPPSRGTDLPDIEDINSSLRPEEKAAEQRKAATNDPVDEAEHRRGFRLGFTVIVAAAVVLVCLYIYAPVIIAQMPASEPAMIAYVDWANGARDGIDNILMRSANGLNVLLERIGVEI
ncbi:MAG: zinc-ribbon domain-containing protein, partial [Pseudomonadota bacterium]